MTTNSALAALNARADLTGHSQGDAVMLFALELAFDIQDPASVAASSLTDHGNDKSCDLVFVDRDAQRIVVGQGYWATTEKASAPSSKAADLNQGVSWLLTGDVATLPDALRSAAMDVRDALENDAIREFHIWYCHNLAESDNVERELKQAEVTAESLLKRHFSNAAVERVTHREIGRATLESMYQDSRSPILVGDEYKLTVNGGYVTRGDKWKAFATYIPGTWIRDIWRQHETALLSPNVRDYLGIVRSERNINNGIKSTAKTAPGRFWIYNNGLTALVNSFELDDELTPTLLTIQGIGIINGAQTTGALGTLTDHEAASLQDVQVMARFVSCTDPETLGDIIRFNNTQNKVAASDFRSTDAVQDRLRKEFESIPSAEYRGGRRGGVRDAISRSPFLLADATVAQALAAFHGHPNLAYNETRRIWEDDATYSSLFHEDTSATHILFCYSLVKAIEAIKSELSMIDPALRTRAQKGHIEFLGRRGSIQLLVSAIAAGLESICARAISNAWKVRFAKNVTPLDGQAAWKPIVQSALAFSQQLSPAADNNLKNQSNVSAAVDTFVGLIESTVDSNKEKYATFTALVTTG